MPSLSDIPGKGLVTGTARRGGKVAAGAGLAMIAVGGYLVRRLVRRAHGAEENGGAASPDPIAETPTAPPGAGANGAEPKAAPEAVEEKAEAEEEPEAEEKPEAAEEPEAAEKPEAAAEQPPPTPKPPRPDPPKPMPPEPEPPAPEPRAEEGPAPPAPPKPETEPGELSKDKDPHHPLNNPAEDPDPTEWPDPYEKRDDPRDPPDPDGEPFGEEPHSPTGAESTSEPHPEEDLEAGDRAERSKREKLDD